VIALRLKIIITRAHELLATSKRTFYVVEAAWKESRRDEGYKPMTKTKLGFAATITAVLAFGIVACAPQATTGAEKAPEATSSTAEPAPAPTPDATATTTPPADASATTTAPAAGATAPATTTTPAPAPATPEKK
jgi:hypothetical protein